MAAAAVQELDERKREGSNSGDPLSQSPGTSQTLRSEEPDPISGKSMPSFLVVEKTGKESEGPVIANARRTREATEKEEDKFDRVRREIRDAVEQAEGFLKSSSIGAHLKTLADDALRSIEAAKNAQGELARSKTGISAPIGVVLQTEFGPTRALTVNNAVDPMLPGHASSNSTSGIAHDYLRTSPGQSSEALGASQSSLGANDKNVAVQAASASVSVKDLMSKIGSATDGLRAYLLNFRVALDPETRALLESLQALNSKLAEIDKALGDYQGKDSNLKGQGTRNSDEVSS